MPANGQAKETVITNKRNYRLRGFESCEPRHMLAGNVYEFDVNQDGVVAPIDALLVIQQLHPDASVTISADVNQDGLVAPVDALLVINALDCNTQGQTSGCSELTALRTDDPDFNTSLIESYVLRGLQATIPAGEWPVRPISLDNYGSVVGMGPGVSELRLELENVGAKDRQDVIGTVIPSHVGQYTKNVSVRDLTINGNYENIDWSDIYNDGNAFGLYLRGAQDSSFENLEIKQVRTDGIYISTVLGFSNNSRNMDFDDITIHHAGRQGVSVVGGRHLRFNNFHVSSIGRDVPYPTSPRAAIDIEPEARSQRLAEHISIRNWTIEHVGQGVLIDGTNSSQHAADILVENVTMTDLDGPQSLAARFVERLTVRNVSSEGHAAKDGGLGVALNNTNAEISELKLQNFTGINYPFKVDGSSFVRINDLLIEGSERGFMQIGSEPSDAAHNTFIEISSFAFQNSTSTESPLVPIRVNSNRSVALLDGVMANIGDAPYALQHATDVFFRNVIMEPGRFGMFESDRDARLTGSDNSWQ